MKEGKSDQATRCVKSSIMTKFVDYILSIDIFEQQYVVLKVVLQSPRLKYHVHIIGIDPYLSNNAIYEHKYLENIKNLYEKAGKCDDQKQLKYILVRQQKRKMYIIPTISTPNHHSQCIASTYSSRLNSNITMILPPVGK